MLNLSANTETKLKSELETYAATLIEFANQLSDIAESETLAPQQIEFLQERLSQKFLCVCLLPPTSRRELAECVTLLAAERDEESDPVTVRANTIFAAHQGEMNYTDCVEQAETEISVEANDAAFFASGKDAQ